MSGVQTEVYEALRAIDIPEDKAAKAAMTLGQRDHDVSTLKTHMILMKVLMVFVLVFQAAIFVKLFIRWR
jgi:hypothetical protein